MRCASELPLTPAWLLRIQVGTDPPTPALARSVPGRLAPSFQPRKQGPRRRWWHCPLPTAGHQPQLPSGWGPVGGELPSATPASDWLWSAAVPATRLPLPAGAATSVVMANAARRSGHSCASQRPASPTRSQTPQLCAPDPSPAGRPPSRAAWSPRPPLSRAARPSPPSPLAHQACAPLAKPAWGPRPLHAATPALRGAPPEGGEAARKGGGEGGS